MLHSSDHMTEHSRRIDTSGESAVIKLATEQPAHEQVRVSNDTAQMEKSHATHMQPIQVGGGRYCNRTRHAAERLSRTPPMMH